MIALDCDEILGVTNERLEELKTYARGVWVQAEAGEAILELVAELERLQAQSKTGLSGSLEMHVIRGPRPSSS